MLDVLRPTFDWRTLMAMPADELERISRPPGFMGPVYVAAGHQCLVLTGCRFDLVAAGLVDADESWPGGPGTSPAPRWVTRADGRRCALSYLPRRKAGAHRVVLGRLTADVLREERNDVR